MKSRPRVILIPVALLLMALPIMGCATKEAPAPTPTTVTVEKPDEIVFNGIMDLSGPYSTAFAPSVAAHDQFWPWFNEEGGGIDGVPIKFVWHDTRGERAAALAAYSKFRDDKPKPVVFAVIAAVDIDALYERAAEDKIPLCTCTGTEASMWPPGWVFSSAPDYPDATGGWLDWLSEEWAKTGETRKCRLALFNPDYPAGHDCATPEIMKYIEAKGNLELVSNTFFDYKALDLSSDMLRVMQAEPDWIYGFYYATAGAAVFKSVESAGFLGKVNVSTVLWGMQPEVVAQCGPEVVEGVTGAHCVPPFMPEGMEQVNTGMEFVAQLFEANKNPPGYRTSGYSNTIQMCFWVTDILKKAVKEVGWDKLDGTAVYNAWVSTREMDLGGIGSWGAEEGRRSSNRYQINEFQNGIPIPITSWRKCPDLRPAEFRTQEYKWAASGWPEGWFK